MKRLPIDYAVRNLSRSPLRLAIALVGSCLVVMLVVASSAFVRGLERTLAGSGSERNVLLLGAGSEESIERSEISAAVPGQAAVGIPGIRHELGMPLVSPEVHMALGVSTAADAPAATQVVIRGVTTAAFLVHPQVRLTDGRVFSPAEDEVIVGALVAARLGVSETELAVGNFVWIDGRRWRISGRFEAPNTVMNGEIWCPVANLQILTRRDSYSCVAITLGSGEFADVDAFTATRLDLELVAMREIDYYGDLIQFYRPVRAMIAVTAGLVAIGGLLGGLNTMYAAFAARTRETGMLRTLGFGRRAVILSFVQESTLIAAAGTLLGSAASVMFLNGIEVQFSMGAFGLIVDGASLLIGSAAGLALGVAGALPPTLSCLRLPISVALKAV